MNTRLLAFFLLTSMFLLSCGNSSSSKTADAAVEAAGEAIKEAVDMKFTLSPFSESPAFTDAEIQSMQFQEGKFDFGVLGTDYKLGEQTPDADNKMCANSAKGQHIHLIVDNKPYAAKYTSSFDYDLEDGEHYLLAFLSRSYHESIKTDKAHVAQKVTTKGNSIVEGAKITEPMLFYSRPKGTYVGKDTEKVMLDFYLANTDISASGNKIKAEINGEEHMIDTWKPYFIEGLPMGTNSIRLTLVDKDGNKIDTPLNPVTRTFELKKDPTPAE